MNYLLLLKLFPISVICAFFISGLICTAIQMRYEFRGQCPPNVNKFGAMLIFVFSIIIWIGSYMIFSV